jgi:hypothetical protein
MMNRLSAGMVLAMAAMMAVAQGCQSARQRWTAEKANAWHQKTPWLVGCNYGPAYAINQLEMWQAETFDLAAIDKELGWAAGLGFNSIRVFLHHLLWEQDSQGLLKRMDQFLDVADKHKIGVMFVLFDSVWDPSPKLGKQREPRPHLHNSGWVQSPGKEDLANPARYPLLEAYVKGVVGRFRNDQRVQVWDIWNEPDNPNKPAYDKVELPNKVELMMPLLRKSFQWAREAGASQPLTSGLWLGDRKADPKNLKEFERLQLEESDVVSFHSYGNLDEVKAWVKNLRTLDPARQPLLCTEYMARPQGSTFAPILEYFKQEKIGAYNWGFVQGKTQTIYPWDSWTKQYTAEPPVWFHDIFRTDGTPYRAEEVEYIRRVTGKARQ